jgi:hypothetical protein
MFQYFCVNRVVKLIKIYTTSTTVRCRAVRCGQYTTLTKCVKYPLPFHETAARTTPPVLSLIPTANDSTLRWVHVFTFFVFLKILLRFFPIVLCSGKLNLREYLTLSNPIFLPTASSPALICFGR